MTDRLPDALTAGLRLVFVGTAASERSAALGEYYANPTNRFWSILHEAGFTPERLTPERWRELLPLGIGFTDLAKLSAGTDSTLTQSDFDLPRFRNAIRQHAPDSVAFTSKAAALIGLGRRQLGFGLVQDHGLEGAARVVALPSTSGLNGHWARQQQHWRDAAKVLGFAS